MSARYTPKFPLEHWDVIEFEQVKPLLNEIKQYRVSWFVRLWWWISGKAL